MEFDSAKFKSELGKLVIDKKYKDVLDYIKSVRGCDYLFDTVPTDYLGI